MAYTTSNWLNLDQRLIIIITIKKYRKKYRNKFLFGYLLYLKEILVEIQSILIFGNL